MADIYNLDNLTLANNIWEITREVNTITGNWFGILFLGTIFFILLISTAAVAGFRKGWIISSFITSFLAVLFWGIKLISPVVLYPCIALLLAGLIFYMVDQDHN
jgi:hypothetical protein